MGKNLRATGFDPWVGKIPWKRAWQPTPVFLPGESHGQKSLVDYSPRGLQRTDTAERLTLSQSLPGLTSPMYLFIGFNVFPALKCKLLQGRDPQCAHGCTPTSMCPAHSGRQSTSPETTDQLPAVDKSRF